MAEDDFTVVEKTKEGTTERECHQRTPSAVATGVKQGADASAATSIQREDSIRPMDSEQSASQCEPAGSGKFSKAVRNDSPATPNSSRSPRKRKGDYEEKSVASVATQPSLATLATLTTEATIAASSLALSTVASTPAPRVAPSSASLATSSEVAPAPSSASALSCAIAAPSTSSTVDGKSLKRKRRSFDNNIGQDQDNRASQASQSSQNANINSRSNQIHDSKNTKISDSAIESNKRGHQCLSRTGTKEQDAQRAQPQQNELVSASVPSQLANVVVSQPITQVNATDIQSILQHFHALNNPDGIQGIHPNIHPSLQPSIIQSLQHLAGSLPNNGQTQHLLNHSQIPQHQSMISQQLQVGNPHMLQLNIFNQLAAQASILNQLSQGGIQTSTLSGAHHTFSLDQQQQGQQLNDQLQEQFATKQKSKNDIQEHCFPKLGVDQQVQEPQQNACQEDADLENSRSSRPLSQSEVGNADQMNIDSCSKKRTLKALYSREDHSKKVKTNSNIRSTGSLTASSPSNSSSSNSSSSSTSSCNDSCQPSVSGNSSSESATSQPSATSPPATNMKSSPTIGAVTKVGIDDVETKLADQPALSSDEKEVTVLASNDGDAASESSETSFVGKSGSKDGARVSSQPPILPITVGTKCLDATNQVKGKNGTDSAGPPKASLASVSHAAPAQGASHQLTKAALEKLEQIQNEEDELRSQQVLSPEHSQLQQSRSGPAESTRASEAIHATMNIEGNSGNVPAGDQAAQDAQTARAVQACAVGAASGAAAQPDSSASTATSNSSGGLGGGSPGNGDSGSNNSNLKNGTNISSLSEDNTQDNTSNDSSSGTGSGSGSGTSGSSRLSGGLSGCGSSGIIGSGGNEDRSPSLLEGGTIGIADKEKIPKEGELHADRKVEAHHGHSGRKNCTPPSDTARASGDWAKEESRRSKDAKSSSLSSSSSNERSNERLSLPSSAEVAAATLLPRGHHPDDWSRALLDQRRFMMPPRQQTSDLTVSSSLSVEATRASSSCSNSSCFTLEDEAEEKDAGKIGDTKNQRIISFEKGIVDKVIRDGESTSPPIKDVGPDQNDKRARHPRKHRKKERKVGKRCRQLKKNDRSLGNNSSSSPRVSSLSVSNPSQNNTINTSNSDEYRSMSHPPQKDEGDSVDDSHIPSKWIKCYMELQAYHALHGNCRVPLKRSLARHKISKSLKDFVAEQRRQHRLLRRGKASDLTEERIRLLENLDFEWRNPKRDVGKEKEEWRRRFEQLRRFRKKYGHCRVPLDKTSPSLLLGLWVKTQRKQYRLYRNKKTLLAASNTTADNIVLEGNDNDFKDRKRSRTGSEKCVEGSKTRGGKSLSQHPSNQISTSMTKERVRLLKSLNFEWRLKDDDEWKTKFEALQLYKSKHGDCDVPSRYEENPSLGRWVKRIRKQYKLYKRETPNNLGRKEKRDKINNKSKVKGNVLNEEKIRMLDAVGFIWKLPSTKPPYDPLEEEEWNRQYERLCQYRLHNGNCFINNDYEDSDLVKWIHEQQNQYVMLRDSKPSTMTRDRIRFLDRVGFCWPAPIPTTPSPPLDDEEQHDVADDHYGQRSHFNPVIVNFARNYDSNYVTHAQQHGNEAPNHANDGNETAAISELSIPVMSSLPSQPSLLPTNNFHNMRNNGLHQQKTNPYTPNSSGEQSMSKDNSTASVANSFWAGSGMGTCHSFIHHQGQQQSVTAKRDQQVHCKATLQSQPPIQNKKLSNSDLVEAMKSVDDPKWLTRFKELVEFHEQNGDCRVPLRYAANAALGRWVSAQRRDYKNLEKEQGKDAVSANVSNLTPSANSNSSNFLTPAKLHLLNSLNFTWQTPQGNASKRNKRTAANNEKNQRLWAVRYEELAQYRSQFGDCRVPKTCHQYPLLRRWVDSQRMEFGKINQGEGSAILTQERIRLLGCLGFEWGVEERLQSKGDNAANGAASIAAFTTAGVAAGKGLASLDRVQNSSSSEVRGGIGDDKMEAGDGTSSSIIPSRQSIQASTVISSLTPSRSCAATSATNASSIPSNPSRACMNNANLREGAKSTTAAGGHENAGAHSCVHHRQRNPGQEVQYHNTHHQHGHQRPTNGNLLQCIPQHKHQHHHHHIHLSGTDGQKKGAKSSSKVGAKLLKGTTKGRAALAKRKYSPLPTEISFRKRDSEKI